MYHWLVPLSALTMISPKQPDPPTAHGPLIEGCIFPSSSVGKESACSAGDPGLIPGSGRSLEKGMATHSSTLAWRIP